MKTIIYLTGKQGTGKSVLCRALKKSVELEKNEHTKIVIHESMFKIFKNVVITEQSFYQKTHDEIKHFAKTNQVYFYSINLKSEL